MFNPMPAPFYHSHRYTADAVCEHCQGAANHESWCITGNPQVMYAYQAVLDAQKLSTQDQLILHALGVTWIDKLLGAKKDKQE